MPALRRRTTHLLAEQPPRVRAFVRVLPLLFAARLRRPSLDQDPPGLERAPRRRRWSRLCEALDLPPVATWYNVRPLVQALVLAPTPLGQLELLVIPHEGLSRSELHRVSARVDATVSLAARHAPGLEVRMASLAELSPSLFAWCAVVAGAIPPGFDPQGPVDWFDVLLRAPSALLRCLTSVVPRDAPAPLELLRAGAPAHLERFLASWSADPLVRDVVTLARASLTPAELDGLSYRLRRGAMAAVARLPVAERRLVRKVVRPLLFARRVPRVFAAHLDRLARTRAVREVQQADGWRLEIEGLVVARAPGLDALRALAMAESPALQRAGAPWGRLRELLAHPQPRTRSLVVLEPGFVRHLVISVPPSGRPRARRVDAGELLRFVLLRHREGLAVELMPMPGADPTLVARLSQILSLPLSRNEHLAFQMGDTVLLVGEGRPRSLPLARAFLRPRRVRWVPEQAEALRALRPPMSTGLPTVHVVALPHGEDSAALYALDARGSIFCEFVPTSRLQLTLNDYRELITRLAPPSLVSATVHPLLTSLDGRRTEPHSALRLDLELAPRRARVRLDDEWFGAAEPLGYAALAEAILSHWAPGVWAPLSVPHVIAEPGTPVLELLAARSRTLRRIDAQLRRIALTLRAA